MGVTGWTTQPGGMSCNANMLGQRKHFIGAFQLDPRLHTPSNKCLAHIESQCTPSVVSESPLELDSHADTACMGSDGHVICYMEKTCQVMPYHPGYEPIKDVPNIVQAAAAYMDEHMGRTFILFIKRYFILEKV